MDTTAAAAAPAGEKVYTDADTRLYAVRGPVVRFPPGTLFGLNVENPVPLQDATGKNIGSANITASDGAVTADALFQYGCPERLDIEAGTRHYFHAEMAQHFLYLDREGLSKVGVLVKSIDIPDGKRVPFVVLVVKGLLLSSDPRVDANIDPVVAAPEEESA